MEPQRSYHHISTRLQELEGKALTNFSRTLPTEDSDLTQQILRNPYSFEFLTLSSTAKERELERGLLKHLRDLLLELGRGFSFVGSQVPLEIGGETFYSMKELRVLAERWRNHYNTARPHSSLGYRPPAPEAWLAATVRRQEEPVASLPAPLAAMACIDLNSEIAALH